MNQIKKYISWDQAKDYKTTMRYTLLNEVKSKEESNFYLVHDFKSPYDTKVKS